MIEHRSFIIFLISYNANKLYDSSEEYDNNKFNKYLG